MGKTKLKENLVHSIPFELFRSQKIRLARLVIMIERFEVMKFNTILPKKLRPYFQNELQAYNNSFAQHDLQTAWNHLERAHVIGQSYPWPHTYVHWKMLQFGISIKSWKEVLGQIPRLLVGGVKSFVGKIPVGNTGGANVPPLKPLPIDPEIMEMFREAGLEEVR